MDFFKIGKSIYKFFTSSLLAVVTYDCGDMSDVVLCSNSYDGLVQVTSDGFTGNIVFTSGMAPIRFLCSGDLDIDSPLMSVTVFLSHVSLQGVWSENFLMGLAGLACGFLFASVLTKYAV